jgi:hypothetical protein
MASYDSDPLAISSSARPTSNLSQRPSSASAHDPPGPTSPPRLAPPSKEKEEPSARTSTAASVTLNANQNQRRPKRTGILGWVTRLGAGIIGDIRARGPWYVSDWTDAWNYRVIPATALIFFAKYVVL